MSAPNQKEGLAKLIDSPVISNEPMSLHTSWRIGGPADLFVEPKGTEELRAILLYAKEKALPITVIGAGTNLLVGDGGIHGLVIKIAGGFSDLKVAGEIVTAGAGAKLNRLVSAVKEAGLGGFEFIAGIPGTVGGAVAMNAGAYGSSISERVLQVTCLDFEGNRLHFDSSQMDWGYRKSVLQGKDLIVTEVVLKGYPREKSVIVSEIEKIVSSRKVKQPLEYPSAGSVFKNPPGNYAGKLIRESQCQGLQVGDAQVSTKHANFIINLDKATAADVLSLIEVVKGKVKVKFGISLEAEVKVLGRN